MLRRTVFALGLILSVGSMALSLSAACDGGGTDPAADAPVAVADVALVCADPMRTAEAYVQTEQKVEGCSCGASQWVTATFDANGYMTGLVGKQPNGDPQPLPAQLERCLLDLFTGYCYPTLAGMTREFMSCHSWIA